MDNKSNMEHFIQQSRKLQVNRDKGTYIDPQNGKEISFYYTISQEELEQLTELIDKLSSFCEERRIPVLILVQVHNAKDHGGIYMAGSGDGPRTCSEFRQLQLAAANQNI